MKIGSKKQIKDSLKTFNFPPLFDNSEGNNAIVVFPSGSSSDKSYQDYMTESSIGDSIFSILFEEDDGAGAAANEGHIDESEIEQALYKALEEAHADEIGEFIVLKPKTLHESEDNKEDGMNFASINGVLSSKVKKFVESKVKGKFQTSWFIAVAKSDDVLQFLKDHSLGNEDDYEKLDKDYAFIFLTFPKSKHKMQTSDKKKIKRPAGTSGYEHFTPEVVKSIIEDSIHPKKDFNVFTVDGTPSKASVDSDIFNGSKSTKSLAYYETDVIPEYKVYLAALDNVKGASGDEEDVPSPTVPPSPSGKGKKMVNAYAMMFGSEEIDMTPAVDDKQDIEDIKADNVKRNDLYIIPMPGLKYEDPEYANKNLM